MAEALPEPAAPDVVEQQRRLRWYVGLDQRLAHRLRFDDLGAWKQETLCGKGFWPWFRAGAKERRCVKCRRLGGGHGV